MGQRFDTATTAVLHAALTRLTEVAGTVGGRLIGIGRITHTELVSDHAELLDEAGVTVGDFPDGAFWTLCVTGSGLVFANSFGDEHAYRSHLTDVS